MHHPRPLPVQLLLLAQDDIRKGGPPDRRRTARCPDTHGSPGLGRTYGVPRITAELRENGEVVNHKRIARVMKTIGLAGLRLRRRHRTTASDPAAAKIPDLIGR
ncbi:transposase, partial [Streptomyces sp. 8P21H-1]|nr:transposase [Streptomyces sp. 8P21H-1]